MDDVHSWQRRALLKGASALLAVSAMGCASVGTGARPRVVVVGGGWGGLGAIRALAASGKVDLTLIEPNDGFMSCPLSVLYIAGRAPASDFQRGYQVIDGLGVRRIRERVVEIDRATRQVKTAAQRIPYDFLVLSPGVDYMEDSLPGYAAARDLFPVGFRAFEQMAVQRQVAEFLDKGGEFLISVPKPPYRCPPAPYERACMIAEHMKEKGTKGKILLVDANPNPMPPPMAKPVENAMRELYSGQIEYIKAAEPKSIDAGRKVLSTSKGDIRFTYANIVLPMRAPGLVRQAGLGERWASVQVPTFQSVADPLVYVVGDAQGQPLPKSGHVAFGAGQQVAEHILQTIAGTVKKPELGDLATLPPGICWAKVSRTHAIMINVTSSVEFGQPPKLVYNVDPVHNTASSKGAMDWGRDMWNSMLGS